MMTLIKKLFGTDENTTKSFALACGIHVIHAFLYGVFGGIKNTANLTSTNWNLVLFENLWQYIGIIVEYYIAFRYIQLIVSALIRDINTKNKREIPGKNLFLASSYMAVAYACIRFMEYFGSVFWKVIFTILVLGVFFAGAMMVAGGSFAGFFQGTVLVITAGPMMLMAEVAAFFAALAPLIVGLAALDIIVETFRGLFG